MITTLKLVVMSLLIGTYNPYWGHTYIAEGNGKVYALRSLAEGSSLCVLEQPKHKSGESLSITTLDSLGEQLVEVTTPGKHSCHITLLERQAVLADYTSGTLTLFELNAEGIPQPNPQVIQFEGSGPHPKRQTSPHIHSSWLSPDGKMLLVVDLGCDCLYRFDVEGGRVVLPMAERIALPSGCGPRHCAFSRAGEYTYVATELSDEVLVYSTSDFKLLNRYVAHSENPEGGSHIVVSDDGKYLYLSSRVSKTAGDARCKVRDGIAQYKCLEGGALEYLGYQPTGAHPRHFAISPDGEYMLVACRDDDRVEIYPLNKRNGVMGKCVKMIETTAPVYVGFK